MTKANIVVLGGGTGSYVVLSGLKKYEVDLKAIISVADSGGSTGRLRDEFGFQPVGDLRQGLAALAGDEKNKWIRELLLYRFSKGSGIEGHNLGNLILTALQDLTGSTPRALEIAADVFNLQGSILPITTDNIELVIEYSNGAVEIGERTLDEQKHGGDKIVSVKTSPRATIYSKAKDAIMSADLIIIGPGDLYGSIVPNLVVEGTKQAFKKTPAKVVYVLNLMTHFTQTHNMTAADHVQVIEKLIGRKIDTVLINNAPIPENLQTAYATQHEFKVTDDLTEQVGQTIIRAPLILEQLVEVHPKDEVPRSYLRHDSKKLAKIIWEYIHA